MSRSRVSANARTEPLASSPRTVRCAIYTRKSTDEGLEQEFNSLDAQREAAEAFIRSQGGEGWVCLPERFDDGGFTGGNMDRPALSKLLKAIEAGQVDCVVVYKVDRLSRSLLDFAPYGQNIGSTPISSISQTCFKIRQQIFSRSMLVTAAESNLPAPFFTAVQLKFS